MENLSMHLRVILMKKSLKMSVLVLEALLRRGGRGGGGGTLSLTFEAILLRLFYYFIRCSLSR